MRSLYLLREHCGAPSIAEQTRFALRTYLEAKEREIGTSIEDAAEAIEENSHERSDDQA